MYDLEYKKALTTYLEGFVSDRRRGRIKEVLNARTNHLTIVLEDVYQSHNYSAVLRSADIFGIQSINFIENRNKYKISEDVSMGSTQWLTLKRYHKKDTTPHVLNTAELKSVNPTAQCLSDLKAQGYKIVATSLHQNSVSLSDLDIKQPIALVFGTELTGVTADVEMMADEFVKIPMYGFTESFNISVCVALCMYELSTRIRKELTGYELEALQKADIYTEWLKVSIKKRELIIKEFDTHYFANK